MKKKRALIVRLSSLGDVIFTIPMAAILKNNGYEITWIVSEKGNDVVKNNPYVDEAILVPLKKWKKQNFKNSFNEYISMVKYIRSKKFDIGIDSQGLFKSFIWLAFSGAKRRITSLSGRELSYLGGNEILPKEKNWFTTHAVDIYLKYAKHIGLNIEKIEIALPDSTVESIKKIDSLLANIDKTKPLVAIAPATTWETKHWNKEHWKTLIKQIENDYTLVFTGTNNDSELIEYISENKHLNLAGQTSVLELTELFRRSDMVVSLDSGSTHLAWATTKPKIVSIFCSTPPAKYAPKGSEDKYIALGNSLNCAYCHERKCPLKENKNLCTFSPKPEEVLTAIHKLLPIKEEV